MNRREAITGNVAAVACMLLWATNFPVAAALLESWPPLLLTAERSLIGGVVVGLAAVAAGQARSFFALARSLPALAASAALAASTLLFVYGQKLVDPVAAAVIVSAMPIFSLLMGWLAGRERLTPQLAAALALAVAGGAITSLVASPGAETEPSAIGALAMLAAVIGYVWYTRVMVDRLPQHPDMAKTAVTMMTAGLISTLAAVLYPLTGAEGANPDVSATSLALLVWLGGGAVGASAVFWFWAGRTVGVTVASMHHNLVPFYVIVMAALAGATVTPQHVVGALLVIAGAVLAQVPLGALLASRAVSR
jgi:drug/metabolite transporter (DMT)-like permease